MMVAFNAKPNVGITSVLRRYCVGAVHAGLKREAMTGKTPVD